MTLTGEIRRVLTAGRLAHLVTVNPDGSPQMSAVWIGLDGNDIVIGHLSGGRKVTNIARNPRVAMTVEADGANPIGMANYLIVYGNARLVEGGAAELLQRLARGIASAVTILNPSTVIVGGGVSRAGERLREPLERRIAGLVPVPPRVVLSTLGDESVALGAARLALQAVEGRLFDVVLTEAV